MLALDQDLAAQIGIILKKKLFCGFAAVRHEEQTRLTRNNQLKHECLIIGANRLEIWRRKKNPRRDIARESYFISGLTKSGHAFFGRKELEELSVQR